MSRYPKTREFAKQFPLATHGYEKINALKVSPTLAQKENNVAVSTPPLLIYGYACSMNCSGFNPSPNGILYRYHL